MNLITNDERILPGITNLKNLDRSIFYLVTIPRVRPHKYLELTKAEALIFLIFSFVNDTVISINKKVNEEDVVRRC